MGKKSEICLIESNTGKKKIPHKFEENSGRNRKKN